MVSYQLIHRDDKKCMIRDSKTESDIVVKHGYGAVWCPKLYMVRGWCRKHGVWLLDTVRVYGHQSTGCVKQIWR